MKLFHKYSEDYKTIKSSKYFNRKWYLKNYPDVAKAKFDPIEHFLKYGLAEFRNPSATFNSYDYINNNPDVGQAGMNPLLHYELAGKNELRHGGILETPLNAYDIVKKSRFFDKKYYLKNNEDVKIANCDPVEHYLYTGWREGRLPSKKFQQLNLNIPDNINPVVYIETHKQELLTPTSANTPQSQEYINHLHRMMTDKSQFVDKMEYNPDFGNINTKLIAFYLPQFHLFKENEQWHGRGFTEWTNVTKAIPHFTGHIQPQLPIDVGFYDLSNIDVMARQAELAKQYGVHGFCFHYYWFSGKKLMEKPIYNWLNHPEIDFPFCLCWANENWSRLWDGGNKEVLMKQELLDGDDKKFADDIIPFFQDKRYIKIDGKPLFVVYRPKLFEQERFNKFIDILKSECKKVGIPDIYVLVSNSFGFNEAPSQWSANGIVEFPPHSMNYIWANKEFIFSNSKITVVDAIDYIKNKKYMYETEHNVFKTVFPSWDNTARKAYTGATCFFGETPQLYRQWLSDCIQWTRENHPKNEQIVFVNAWNEWAEGAHLEPDHYYGYAYLEETKNALLDSSARTKKIIYVGHDANFYGAQLLTLNIIKSMHEKFGYNVELLLLNDGELMSEYRKYANVRVLANKTQNEIYDIVSDLKSRGYNTAVTNTIITGNITDVLKRCDITPISLIHELPKIIKHYHAESAGESIAKNSGKIISASSYVSNAFAELFGPDENKLAVISLQNVKSSFLSKLHNDPYT